MPEFTQALVAVWEATVSGIFTQLVALPPMEGMARSIDLIGQWPLRADAAVRAWAWANPVIATAVRRQEAAWERLMCEWISQVVPDPQRCRMLAHMFVAQVIGMMQLQRPPDPELITAVSLELLRNNIGIDPAYRPPGATVPGSRGTTPG